MDLVPTKDARPAFYCQGYGQRTNKTNVSLSINPLQKGFRPKQPKSQSNHMRAVKMYTDQKHIQISINSRKQQMLNQGLKQAFAQRAVQGIMHSKQGKKQAQASAEPIILTTHSNPNVNHNANASVNANTINFKRKNNNASANATANASDMWADLIKSPKTNGMTATSSISRINSTVPGKVFKKFSTDQQ
jgi:hypothetical protein